MPDNVAEISWVKVIPGTNVVDIITKQDGTLTAEINIRRNTQNAQLNVLDYGAVGDNSTDNTQAIARAIAALPTGKGGTIYFPAGTYRTGAIDIRETNSVRLVGDGGISANWTATNLVFTGSSSSFIRANGSSGCVIKGFTMACAGVLTATRAMVDFSNIGVETVYATLENCYIGGDDNGIGVNCNKSTDISITRCNFQFHKYAVVFGLDATDSYCNGSSIRNCKMSASVTSHILGLGAGLVIDTCTFEPLKDVSGVGSAGAVLCTANHSFNDGVSIFGCWMGDTYGGATAPWMTLKGRGIRVFSNQFGNHGLKILNHTTGIAINNNLIYTNDISGIDTTGAADVTAFNFTGNSWVGTNHLTGEISTLTDDL